MGIDGIDERANYIWKTCVGAMSAKYRRSHYAEVLKTRQRSIWYKLNGEMVSIERSMARDYLRQVLGIKPKPRRERER